MATGGLLKNLLKIPGMVVGGGKSFGDYAAKFGVGASRSKFYKEKNTFKTVIGATTKENENIARAVAHDSDSIIDEVFAGTLDKDDAAALIVRNLDEAGYSYGKAGHRTALANNIIDHGMEFTRSSNIVRRFGTVGGSLGIVGISALVCMNIGSWISNLLGGLGDKFLNWSSESDVGTAIVIGSVVIGSVYILQTTKQALGS